MLASYFSLVALSSLLGAAAPETAPLRSLAVEPTQLTLLHGDDRQGVLVTATRADRSVVDRTRSARYRIAHPNLATVSAHGVVAPLAAGETTLIVEVDNHAVQVPIAIKSAGRRPVSFRNDVLPILAKADCSSGPCHGTPRGKGGFTLSLRGCDPAGDYASLTRAGNGRNIDRLHPAQSLFLLKAAGLVRHESDKLLLPNSPQADMLRRWIAQGLEAGAITDPHPVALEMRPAFTLVPQPGLTQQLRVRARFGDGSVRDVTEQARYSSNHEETARVGEDGLITTSARGDAAILARYGTLVAVSTVAVIKHNAAFVWNNPPENNFVDKLINANLLAREIRPSELCTDTEFLRRVSLDLVGLQPLPPEVRAFLADKRPDKRARKIDELLARPEHAEFWALKWAEMLRLDPAVLKDKGALGFHRWLRDSIAANKPLDRLVREILTAEGSCFENPPANFYRAFPTPDAAAEASAQIFLGIRLECAKCHDHPFEKWGPRDYFGLSAFFSQVARKPGAGRDDLVIYRAEIPAQARHAGSSEMLAPSLLDGKSVAVAKDQDARGVLAGWLTDKTNPWLARATVNRLWSQLFARGLIDPVDDMRSSNPAINEALLQALAKELVDQGFDMRRLLRSVLGSRTYQLAVANNPFNAEDTQNFSRCVPRLLRVQQLTNNISQVTGVPDDNPLGLLPKDFQGPTRQPACSCERDSDNNIAAALILINSDHLVAKLANPNGYLATLIKTAGITDDQVAEEVTLRALCRPPTPVEIGAIRGHLAGKKDRFQAAQDVLWALLNTKDFIYNH